MKLTKTAIDRATYNGDGSSRDVRWDDELAGFGLRIYPSGKKSFVLSYRSAGRKRLMVVGAYGVKTLDQARKEARVHLVALEGDTDPLEARRQRSRGETVKDLCRAYISDYAKPQKKSWQDDQRRIVKQVIPAWGNLKAASIKHSDVATLHRKIGERHPYEANRTVKLISKMFNLAELWDFVPDGFKNPARNINEYAEHKRDRWVTPDELPHIIAAVDKEDTFLRAAIWLYLLTGARKNELLRAKWADVDYDRRELRLPETKTGKVHYIPLSQPAITLLRELPRVNGNPFILPGMKENAHLVNIDKPWRRVRSAATLAIWRNDAKLAELIDQLADDLNREPTLVEVRASAKTPLPGGVDDVRLHDLRRTVGSWLAQAGNSLHLIGRVLNHTSQATTAVYARFGQDQVREALEQHGQRLMGIAGKAATAKVVAIKK